jgi:hypothetical protein
MNGQSIAAARLLGAVSRDESAQADTPAPKPTSFDGGARQLYEPPKTPEQAALEHGRELLALLAARRGHGAWQ